jgi:hypothetical protein
MFLPFRLTIYRAAGAPVRRARRIIEASRHTVISSPMPKSIFWLLNAASQGTLCRAHDNPGSRPVLLND